MEEELTFEAGKLKKTRAIRVQGRVARQRPRPTLRAPRLHLKLPLTFKTATIPKGGLRDRRCHLICDVSASGLSCTRLSWLSATLAVNRLGRCRATRPRMIVCTRSWRDWLLLSLKTKMQREITQRTSQLKCELMLPESKVKYTHVQITLMRWQVEAASRLETCTAPLTSTRKHNNNNNNNNNNNYNTYMVP